MELKKKLTYKGSDKSQLINPELLYGALHELAEMNPLYQVPKVAKNFCSQLSISRALPFAIRSSG